MEVVLVVLDGVLPGSDFYDFFVVLVEGQRTEELEDFLDGDVGCLELVFLELALSVGFAALYCCLVPLSRLSWHGYFLRLEVHSLYRDLLWFRRFLLRQRYLFSRFTLY